jgi:glycyl-tRNA synthetase (class II)
MHGKFAKGDDQAFRNRRGEKVVPYVIEPSMGVDRTVLAFLLMRTKY